MVDYGEGIKKEVAEVKFLIHDLRVERFINETIHYHVTVNTDLEIYNVDQAHVLHTEDLQELKKKAGELRRAFQDYSNAVRSFSPDKTILLLGNRYIDTIRDVCELILNPLWGRVDRVLSFLPEECRSVQSRSHYRNCVRWICGVYYRIEHFLDEQRNVDVQQEFDIAADIEDFTRNVIYGYVAEKGSGRIELRLDELQTAVLCGNLHRFRRMFFNLVMNAVDAMSARKVGLLTISAVVEGGHVVLRVRDNGAGMTREKVRQLLADRETLDGELHSLGFVFVRRTIAQFGGHLSIDSEPGEGTMVTVALPHRADRPPPPRPRSRCEQFDVLWGDDGLPAPALLRRPPEAETPPVAAPAPAAEGDRAYGELVLEDYRRSEAAHPGSIFAIAVTPEDRVEFFTHRPYERHWNISHEDLSPMFFLATLRGRLEEDDERNPVLILKPPQNVGDYFDFKEVPAGERSRETYLRMVRDEIVRTARKLMATGMSPTTRVHVADLTRFFPQRDEELETEPFPIESLARQTLGDA